MSNIIAHTIKATLRTDKVIWFTFMFFAAYSLLTVYSATGTLAFIRYDGEIVHFLKKQFLFLLGGVSLIMAVQFIPFNFYGKLAQIGLYITIPLLLATLVAGSNINDANRWLVIPGTGVSFQTSDLAKIVLIMYTARMLSKKQDVIKDFQKGFLPVFIPALIIAMLIFPANFSTALMLMGITVVMMFIGRVSMRHIIGLMGIGIIIIVLALSIGRFFPQLLPRAETWVNRIENFTKDNADDQAENYQVVQSKIAVASGGIAGKGPGNSTQRNFLPHPYSDFIFAIIVEEYGLLLGAIPIIALYIIFLFRGIKIASRSQSKFGALLAIGISFSIAFQAFINMAVAVHLFPVTGQTLPLISMGGTSLLITCIQIGLLLAVSMNNDRAEKKLKTIKA